jgi:hypothetical protein
VANIGLQQRGAPRGSSHRRQPLPGHRGGPLDHWNNAGEDFQAFQKAHLLRSLGEEVIKHLAPEVLVTMPEPTLSGTLNAALRPFDYPGEY